MKTRTLLPNSTPDGYNALLALEKYMSTTSLDPIHKELIKIRASQINGCAYCLNMHTKDARKYGETEQRLYVLSAWRESDLFTEAEQALLALTEEVTQIQHHVSDETYANAAKHFDEKYLGEIIMAIISINSWNRVAITTGMRAS